MKTALIIIVSVIAGVGLLTFILKQIFTLIQKRLDAYIRDNFDTKDIILSTAHANFFGQRSKGGRQIRGNGALVLTKTSLCFVMVIPKKQFIIPLTAIESITTPTSFNGKSVFSKLLCVNFSIDNQKDAMGWAVKHPEQWKENILKTFKKRWLYSHQVLT